MPLFAILLGGDLAVTPRLLRQIAGARAIAADGGMAHSGPLGLEAELWVGDFDSSGAALLARYPDVSRQIHATGKDATDGDLAIAEAIRRGASDLVLAGGFGGQADHMIGHLGLALRLARGGHGVLLTSGREEAWPVLPGRIEIDAPYGSRLSFLPFADCTGLSLDGVKWPLDRATVPLGSSLTLSNEARGPVTAELAEGYGIAFVYPPV